MKIRLTRCGTPLPSPGGQYVAIVGVRQEVWGNYLADFALWAVADPLRSPRLLYYRAGYAAHSLSTHEPEWPVFLCWSQTGDWLTFYEVKRQQTYQVVFIHATAGQVYRVPATTQLLVQLPAISQSGLQIEAFLRKAAHQVSTPILDDAPAGLRPC